MAEHEYFNIGSIVCCTTCYNQKVQGEVLAYDVETKMLAISIFILGVLSNFKFTMSGECGV